MFDPNKRDTREFLSEFICPIVMTLKILSTFKLFVGFSKKNQNHNVHGMHMNNINAMKREKKEAEEEVKTETFKETAKNNNHS